MKQLRPYQLEALTALRARIKEVTHPLLVNASVGAGKSLILSEILLDMERAGYRALCLTLNSNLIEQNAETYRLQGGSPGIYCAALKEHNITKNVIFASPQSVVKGISEHWYRRKPISEVPFNLIIIDECHNINHFDSKTIYMRILNHYGLKAQTEDYRFRIVGLTGTAYRGKGESIVGPNQFFKEQVCEITTSWLISNQFLVPVVFGVPDADHYDYSKLRVNNLGKFRESEIQEIVDKNERLTADIMRDVTAVVEHRIARQGFGGAFIFAATRKHCDECARSLPEGQWGIITSETKHEVRKQILAEARASRLRYLVSVGCLNVGIDVPNFDVAAWLRPTESLLFYTQGIGRVLRLSPGKQRATVLDYAQNLERHGDIDDPIINEALKPNADNEKDYCIPCYTCGTDNTVHARRCIGRVDNKRCDHFFQFKACGECGIQNDITSRYCRECECELIDPNAKLNESALLMQRFTYHVVSATYTLMRTATGMPLFRVSYCVAHSEDRNTKMVMEHFVLNTKKSKDIFYHHFVKLHHPEPYTIYPYISNKKIVQSMISELKTPNALDCVFINDKYKIVEKFFENDIHKAENTKLEVLYLIKKENKDRVSYIYLCKNEQNDYCFIPDAYKLNNSLSKQRHMDDFPRGDLFFPRYIYIHHKGIVERSKETIYNLGGHHITQQHLDTSWMFLYFDDTSTTGFISYDLYGVSEFYGETKVINISLYKKQKHIIDLIKEKPIHSFNAWSYNRQKYITELIYANGEVHKIEQLD